MGLAALIRNSVALADRLTADAQVPVQHKAKTGKGTNGMPVYATTATPRDAIVEMKQRTYTSKTGDTMVADGRITFLRNETIGNEDQITLPDGRVVYVVYVDEPLLDPVGGGYLTQVYVGATTGTGVG